YAVHACLILIHRPRRLGLRRNRKPRWPRVDFAVVAGHHALWHDHRQLGSPPHHAWENQTNRRWFGHYGRCNAWAHCRKCWLNPSGRSLFITSWFPHYLSRHPAHPATVTRAHAHDALGHDFHVRCKLRRTFLRCLTDVEPTR